MGRDRKAVDDDMMIVAGVSAVVGLLGVVWAMAFQLLILNVKIA